MSHEDPYRPNPGRDRGAYTPPTDDDLPFDRGGYEPRRGGGPAGGGGGGAKAPPLTLIISGVVLLLLIIAPSATVAPASTEGLEPLVRRTAEAAGLTVVTTMAPGGGLGIQMSQAPGRETFAWLAALEADHGVKVCSLGVMENADATLNIDGALGQGVCGSAG